MAGPDVPARWPAILDEDTYERLVNLFADPSRRAHVVGRKQHLLSGIVRCGKCGGPLYPVRGQHGEISDLPVRDGAGRQRVRRDLGQRGNPGRVRDRRGPGRAGIPPRSASGAGRRGHQRAAPRGTARGDPQAQDKRAEARRDWAEDTIDKADWLDIKQRTEARIATARKQYDKLTGSAAVFGDIPASDMVRDAWQDWNTDRRRGAVKAVLNQVIVSPHVGCKGGLNLTPELKLQFLCDQTEFDWRF
jgi:site-specific DNA recombinase